MNKIADEVPDSNMMMFVDEAGLGPDGDAMCSEAIFCARRSLLDLTNPILSLDGIITYDIIPGSVTSERFLHFLRELVVSDKPLILLSG